MEYNCSSFKYNNVTAPNFAQQMEALGVFGVAVASTGLGSCIGLTIIFVFNVFNVIKLNPLHLRRLLGWITSMPMAISYLALISFAVPRSSTLCDNVKQIYMPFLLMHFVDLTLLMDSGISDICLDDLVTEKTPIKLCLLPFCCFGICFHWLSFTKNKLRAAKAFVYYLPLVQLIICTLNVVGYLTMLKSFQTQSKYLTQSLSLLNLIIFLVNIWGFNILTLALSFHSNWHRYMLKAKVLSYFVEVVKIQNYVLFAVAAAGSIPCVPPHLSPKGLRKTIEASLILVEALIFGIVFYIVYKSEGTSNNFATTKQSSLLSSTINIKQDKNYN